MKVFKDDRLECLYVSENYRIWFRPCIWEDGTLRWYAIHKTNEHDFILDMENLLSNWRKI